LKKIESVANAALGIDSKRGDTLVVEDIAFRVPPAEPASQVTIVQKVNRIAHDWSSALRVLGILALFLVVYFLVLRPVKKQVVTTVRQLTTQKSPVAIENPADQKALEDAVSKANMRKEIVERIKAEPETASRLLQSWIHSPEAHR
jgi:flagellar M-ring protein FliF